MRRVAAAILATLACLVVATTGAAAAPAPATNAFVQAVFVDFRAPASTTNGGGLVADVLAWADGQHPGSHLAIAAGRLAPGHRYRLVFGSRPCFEALSPTNLITRIATDPSDPTGNTFVSRPLSIDASALMNVRSARLVEIGGPTRLCASPRLLDRASTVHVDGAFARFGRSTGLAFEVGGQPGNEQVDLTLALRGLAPGGTYRLVHSPLSCRQFRAGDPDQPVAVGRFTADSKGLILAQRTATISGSEDVSVGSLRVEHGGAAGACADLHPFALFLPPVQGRALLDSRALLGRREEEH